MDKIDVCLQICPCDTCECPDSECKLIDAYLKQTQAEVINQNHGDAECPNCDHHVYYFQKHCVECGQALEWR